MSLDLLAHARRSRYPASAKLHGGSLGLSGAGLSLAGSGRRRKMRGGGFWGSLWNGIKNVAGKANDFFKKTKIISTIGPLLGPEGAAVGTAAGFLGYGRYHKRIKTYKRRQDYYP